METDESLLSCPSVVYSEKGVEVTLGIAQNIPFCSHRKDFSVDTNESDLGEHFPSYSYRPTSPPRYLPIHAPKAGLAVSSSPPKKFEPKIMVPNNVPVKDQEALKQQESTTRKEPKTPAKDGKKLRFSNFACLLEAAIEGDIAEVKKLIEDEGLHPDTCNADGVTSLHCAAGMSNIELVEYLIQREANVNVCDDHGWTPLHSAAYLNSKDISEVLLNNGADVEASDSQGQTPLGLATDIELIRFIGELVRRKNSAEFVTALYDFDASNDGDSYSDDELYFKKGTTMKILNREDAEWWYAEKDGREGYVPRRYVQ